MKTTQILAILVVLLFISSCSNNTQNNGEKPKPLDNTQPQTNTNTEKTPANNPVETPKEEIKEQPETPVKVDDAQYPVMLTAEKVGSNVKLTWTPYSGKFMSYKIVRSTTDPNPKYPGADLVETIVFANQTTYTDTKAQIGVNYYSVGVLTITNKGDMSNVVSVEFADSKEKQGNEISLTAEKIAEGIQLSWNQYDLAGGQLMYYKVVRSDTNPNPKYPNDNGVAAIPYVDRTSYVDRTAAPGKTYYYALTVVRKDYTRYTSAPVIIIMPEIGSDCLYANDCKVNICGENSCISNKIQLPDGTECAFPPEKRADYCTCENNKCVGQKAVNGTIQCGDGYCDVGEMLPYDPYYCIQDC